MKISALEDEELFESTLCMDERHFTGLHYDLHNLYGLHHSATTYRQIYLFVS